MGTRATIKVIGAHSTDEKLKEYLSMYVQFDGYLSGVGADIKNALEGKAIVNGYSDPSSQLNGAGCAAAYLVSKLKDGCGNVYIAPNCEGEEYNYVLTVIPETAISILVINWMGEELYSGSLDDFNPEMEEAEE